MTMSSEQKLARIEEKLDSMHKDLTKSQLDIEELKKRMNMGAGGIKAIAIFGSILIGITLFITKLLGIR